MASSNTNDIINSRDLINEIIAIESQISNHLREIKRRGIAAEYLEIEVEELSSALENESDDIEIFIIENNIESTKKNIDKLQIRIGKITNDIISLREKREIPMILLMGGV